MIGDNLKNLSGDKEGMRAWIPTALDVHQQIAHTE